ncbi:hypothetical protein IWX49DRAFT_319190 [Phyllosticta citricarpa]|uniref:Uncharacterized protein n=2 Tax=Phyllosticta TaxID=121621 RepID=A0ABR1LI94_9PEZI
MQRSGRLNPLEMPCSRRKRRQTPKRRIKCKANATKKENRDNSSFFGSSSVLLTKSIAQQHSCTAASRRSLRAGTHAERLEKPGPSQHVCPSTVLASLSNIPVHPRDVSQVMVLQPAYSQGRRRDRLAAAAERHGTWHDRTRQKQKSMCSKSRMRWSLAQSVKVSPSHASMRCSRLLGSGRSSCHLTASMPASMGPGSAQEGKIGQIQVSRCHGMPAWHLTAAGTWLGYP